MTSDNMNQKKCGFCGESIPVGAGRCPYCGSILEVKIDNNYQIAQSDIQPVDSDAAGQGNMEHQNGQANPEQQQIGFGGQQGVAEPTGTVPPENNQRGQTEYSEQMHNAYRPDGNGSYRPNYNYSSGAREPLSNGLKVFLTVLFTVLPGIGQLAGIIAAIVFMNSDGDSDRKSFGVALLVASLIMFVISCIGCFVFVIAVSSNQLNY